MRTWDFFKEMDQIQQDIDGIFNGFQRNRLFSPAFEPGLGLRHYPKINLRDDADNIYVEALLPGIDPDKIDMNILALLRQVMAAPGTGANVERVNSCVPLNCRRRL